VELKDLFEEYENNTTNEAKFVHDLDKLDMLLQAYIYENEGINLESFF